MTYINSDLPFQEDDDFLNLISQQRLFKEGFIKIGQRLCIDEFGGAVYMTEPLDDIGSSDVSDVTFLDPGAEIIYVSWVSPFWHKVLTPVGLGWMRTSALAIP